MNKSKYLLENGISELTRILDFCLSKETLDPKLPVFPFTLILSCKNFS